MNEEGEIAPDAVAQSGDAPVTSAPGPAAADVGQTAELTAPWGSEMLQDGAELLAAGGPVVLILLAMSVLALAIILAKLSQFAGAGLTDSRAVDRVLTLWRQGRAEEALRAADAARGPAARALAAALALAPSGEADRAREAAWLAGSQALESARSWLRPLEVIASLAPLLGLFGTVLGMIEAFAELEAAGSRVDPSILSGGIWEALLTTAVGLAVAIPAVAAFNWFERRIERAESLAERAVASLFATASPALQATERRPEPLTAEGRFRAVAPG